jgi:hypothetical protein
MSGMVATPSDYLVEDGMIRNPVFQHVTDDDYTDDLKREVLLELQRSQKVAAEEDLDDFQAERAKKMRRTSEGSSAGASSSGRPRKTSSEVLYDLTKMKRDRVQQIEDELDKMKRSAGAAEEEAKQKFPTLPDDIKDLLNTMKKDVAQAVEEMTEKVTEVRFGSKPDNSQIKARGEVDACPVENQLLGYSMRGSAPLTPLTTWVVNGFKGFRTGSVPYRAVFREGGCILRQLVHALNRSLELHPIPRFYVFLSRLLFLKFVILEMSGWERHAGDCNQSGGLACRVGPR